MFRKILYWTVFILTIIFVLGAVSLLIITYVDIQAHGETAGNLLPAATILFTAISTFSAVYFGWRLDRRQAKELELKLKELELKLRNNQENKKE